MTSEATFDVPPGAAAEVYIIDSQVRVHGLPTALLLTPPLDHMETLPPLPTWCFLVQSSKGEKVLFDLAMPPDLTSYTPAVGKVWSIPGVKVEAGKHVADILQENGIDPADISSVIWRYEKTSARCLHASGTC